MSATILKKITAEAKRIRKQSPRTSWKSAVKQAGAKYRKTAKSAKRPVSKKSATKKKRVGDAVSSFGSAMVAGVKKFSMATVRAQVLSEIGRLEAKKFAAKKVTEKRAIQKKLTEKKRLYKKLS